MTLSPDNQKQLYNVVVEQRQRDKLMLYNLRPIQQLLFIGPSGTGKTLAAKALAGELNLPLISVRLDMPIGDAAAKLRSIIDISQETRGVYLFNEVDAITADGGEARQAINLLLQFVEDDYLNNLIIVATNHPQSFGYETLRRFDQVIKFDDTINNFFRFYTLYAIIAMLDHIEHWRTGTKIKWNIVSYMVSIYHFAFSQINDLAITDRLEFFIVQKRSSFYYSTFCNMRYIVYVCYAKCIIYFICHI